jgi:4-hydroxybenzoate polyprenyltransferase
MSPDYASWLETHRVIVLVRPRAWWCNKVPLSVLTCLLLVDGRPLTLPVLFALLGLVGTVCGVANYGYALNELFDRDEDRRGGRPNVAETAGSQAMWAIVALSAACAPGVAALSGGSRALLLTAGVLLLPLAYSVPPIRTKQREWLGVVCDAVAAHVYPALLAFAIVSHRHLRALGLSLVLTGGLWALMTGLRGILSHQLQSDEHDRAAGLPTVVHRFGHARIASLVNRWVLPVEVLAFAAFVVQCDVTALLGAAASLWVAYEVVKFALDAFPTTVYTRRGERYLPFVDEGGYKVWGPIALALDAAATHLLYLILVPCYVLLFRARILQEWNEIRTTAGIVMTRVRQPLQRARR